MTTYRTKSGKVLTDADIWRLADEAERGYDVERLIRRRSRWERMKAWLRQWLPYTGAVLLALLAASCGGGGTKTVTTRSGLGPPVTQTAPPPVSTTGWTPGSPPGGGVHCGTERWAVKTLSDGTENQINFEPEPSTVTALGQVPVPPGADGPTRTQPELQTYTVTAKLDFVRQEADHDYHLGLSDSGATMIAEIPDPGCQGATSSPFDAQLAQVRQDFGANVCVGAQVTVSGVLFFDRIHGQGDVAPNGVELHPVTAISCGAPTGQAFEAK